MPKTPAAPKFSPVMALGAATQTSFPNTARIPCSSASSMLGSPQRADATASTSSGSISASSSARKIAASTASLPACTSTASLCGASNAVP